MSIANNTIKSKKNQYHHLILNKKSSATK